MFRVILLVTLLTLTNLRDKLFMRAGGQGYCWSRACGHAYSRPLICGTPCPRVGIYSVKLWPIIHHILFMSLLFIFNLVASCGVGLAPDSETYVIYDIMPGLYRGNN